MSKNSFQNLIKTSKSALSEKRDVIAEIIRSFARRNKNLILGLLTQAQETNLCGILYFDFDCRYMLPCFQDRWDARRWLNYKIAPKKMSIRRNFPRDMTASGYHHRIHRPLIPPLSIIISETNLAQGIRPLAIVVH